MYKNHNIKLVQNLGHVKNDKTTLIKGTTKVISNQILRYTRVVLRQSV